MNTITTASSHRTYQTPSHCNGRGRPSIHPWIHHIFITIFTVVTIADSLYYYRCQDAMAFIVVINSIYFILFYLLFVRYKQSAPPSLFRRYRGCRRARLYILSPIDPILAFDQLDSANFAGNIAAKFFWVQNRSNLGIWPTGLSKFCSNVACKILPSHTG
jgi:hypothetical protein